jgi:hypothetical protein
MIVSCFVYSPAWRQSWHFLPNAGWLVMYSKVLHLWIQYAGFDVCELTFGGTYYVHLKGWKSADQKTSVKRMAAQLIFDSKDGGDTLLRNVSSGLHGALFKKITRFWRHKFKTPRFVYVNRDWHNKTIYVSIRTRYIVIRTIFHP